MLSPFWHPESGPSIGMACNIYNDVNAVAGLLETASQFFDELVFFHAGPQGAYSTDGTIELIERWKAKLIFGKIDEGFGIVRTSAVRACSTEWVMVLDADERFHPYAPLLLPHGEGQNVGTDNIHVQHWYDTYDQGAMLRRIIRIPEIDAVQTIRRHWNSLGWKSPTQNWHHIPDRQLRIVRNVEHVQFRSDDRMHERLLDARTGKGPHSFHAEPHRGLFHDHYHCFFKGMEPEQRRHDIAIYDAIHEGRLPPTELPPDASEDLRIHHT